MQAVPLHVAYDRERVEPQREGARQKPPALETGYVYNSLFKGTRLFLYNGTFSAKDPKSESGILELYGCPKLEAGVRYRLTWACWLVGVYSRFRRRRFPVARGRKSLRFGGSHEIQERGGFQGILSPKLDLV